MGGIADEVLLEMVIDGLGPRDRPT